jgi:hypothetical protein
LCWWLFFYHLKLHDRNSVWFVFFHWSFILILIKKF